MNLWSYIQGVRKGKDINYLEREAMKDSFLADALAGYDKIKADHESRIEDLQKKIKKKTDKKEFHLRNWSIAASIFILAIAGGYFFFSQNQSKNDFIAMEEIANTELESQIVNSETALPIDENQETEEAPIIAFTPPVVEDNIQSEMQSVESLAFRDEIITSDLADIQEDAALVSEAIISPIALNELAEAKVEIAGVQGAIEAEVASVKKESVVPKSAIGDREYQAYLKRELIRPTDDECKDAKGSVSVSFNVDGNGRPYNLSIAKSLCPSADREAIRLVKDGPGWIKGNEKVWVHVRF